MFFYRQPKLDPSGANGGGSDSGGGEAQTVSSATGRLKRVPWICGAILFFANLGLRLMNVPFNRLLESTICRDHWKQYDPSLLGPDQNVDEHLCKGKAVQTRLAFYVGLISTIELVCELIASIPLGYVSDKYGRKLLLAINNAGTILTMIWYICIGRFHNVFNIQASIAAPFLFLFTGGAHVCGAAVSALIADVAGSENQLTTIFGYMQATIQVLQFLGPAISSTALTKDIWLPFCLGLASLCLIYPCIAFLPETRRSQGRRFENHEPSTTPDINSCRTPSTTAVTNPDLGDEDENETDPLVSRNDTDVTLIPEESDPGPDLGSDDISVKFSQNSCESNKPHPKSLREYMHEVSKQARDHLQDLKTLVGSSRDFKYYLLVFLANTLARASQNVLLQYLSKRYHIKFAIAGYLLAMKGLFNFILFAALIPLFLRIMTRRYGHEKENSLINLLGMKISVALLFVGVTLVGLSYEFWMMIISLPIYSLGYGLGLFAMTAVTKLTIKTCGGYSHIGRAYAAVVFVETIGALIGVPAVASLWIAGLQIGGWGLTLPWCFCALLYFFIGVIIWSLQADSNQPESTPTSSDSAENS
ncbi:uncharacterized protein Z518_01636 [Rhinocladiella mackenziei CBS 650.93]|uniref:Major facilitator superfamily (MFS) profile domain-containing protein n=1 Tax=Rhinocladiella mackenziei CBS 650.93 TaxID=1442369 RepID=A0A0D2HIT5_9EURO|nr:uncharacterized protein Z518_01636 [Rhinocladiella mackenziei CBS 650.93]KIX10553.1 hypothetical protein Z518_01636 [Rhinocladiella mackenziei CBS 650.93]